MYEIIIMAVLILLLVGFGAAEFAYHHRNLKSIPIRIHVNGTRGKSSVTRLIAAGLRESGIRTFAKTTGTLPRMIIHDGTEYPVYRQSRANIIEQVRIIAFAARNRAEAMVIECMALQPYLQSLCELRLIQSTHGVITNVREDHLDVMGPKERDVALSLLGTTPEGKILFTCERDYPDEFESACSSRGTELSVVSEKEIESLSGEEMSRFPYVEHRENVALALKVCASLGVGRETALRGMVKSEPDPGSMSDFSLDFFGRRIYFINGFAGNDPESTETIWRMALERHRDVESKIMIINSRIDRPDRSRQLGEAMASWPKADRYILIGSGSYFVERYAARAGVQTRFFTNAEDLGTEIVFEEILKYCGRRTMVIGVGNIAGPGLELVTYFKNRSEPLWRD
ncbi:MAG: poly-gamma-glutamate synthase PgsB [Chrysiogenales bacterium]|nr:MAG: poly-gamma-glutamate synthase PgsB [Chrysiogenales bacterium]